MSKSLPRCTMQTKHSGQCGRRCADGSVPPICSVHRQQQTQGHVSALMQPVDLTPEDIYRKLMRDSDPAIRLRAVDAWLTYQDKKKYGCEICRARVEDDKERDIFLEQLTEDDHLELGRASAQYRRVINALYQRHGLEPPYHMSPEAMESAHVITRAETSTQPPKPPAPYRAVVEALEPEPVTVAATPRLGPEHYESVGIFRLNFEGQSLGLTHGRGDEHAEEILSGRISLEQAQKDHAAAQQHSAGFFDATLTKLQGGHS